MLKEQLEILLQIKTKEKLDAEVFNEEYSRVSQELIKLSEREELLE